jgi:hypothetical protein
MYEWNRLWWNRFLRKYIIDLTERCVVYRRAKIHPHMAATLYPLLVPPQTWHAVGLNYLAHLLVSNSFVSVLIETDHLHRTAHSLPCTKSVATKETVNLFLHGVYLLHRLPRVLVIVTANRNSRSANSGKHFEDAVECD